jgi:hypothetical protein
VDPWNRTRCAAERAAHGLSPSASRQVLIEDDARWFARLDFATGGTRIFFPSPAFEGDVWVMEFRR